jgi:hypothetical protein
MSISDADIRNDLNDPDRIMQLAEFNSNPEELIHAVTDNSEAIFTWNYDKGERAKLDKLYEKAKTSQWNAQTDLDWSIEVDPYTALGVLAEGGDNGYYEAPESPFHHFGDKEWSEFTYQSFAWRMSQFLHGEQGALLCTAKIVETVPWIDAKYYAATQVVDEARHVEVFAKYLDEKIGTEYPISPHLRLLLDDIINDNRWDMTYLGMQIMVEGLALAAFGFMHQFADDPLLVKMLRYVMSDEARHVAFGVLSLQELYPQMTQAEIKERQEFAFEAGLRMRDRFLQQEVWDRMGVNVRDAVKYQLAAPAEFKQFQALLFSKIVPNCKKLGLLDAGDGWLRKRFEEIEVIQFEDWADTTEEYGDLDQVAADRNAEPAPAG